VTGVELIDGKQFDINYEVILSAGALVSPKILMLSGIGDPADITPHKIKMAHTLLGVGKNLQDHAAVWAAMKTISRTPWVFHGLNYLILPLKLSNIFLPKRDGFQRNL